MSSGLFDLEQVIHELELSERIEASAPIRFFIKALGADPEKYERDGLGVWLAFPVDVKPLGKFIVAAPEHDKDAGASIWFQENDNLRASILAAAICIICEDRHILFATTEGQFINPDFQAVKTFRHSEETENLESVPTSESSQIKPSQRNLKVRARGGLTGKIFRKNKAIYGVKLTGKSLREGLGAAERQPKVGELEWTFPKLENKTYRQA